LIATSATSENGAKFFLKKTIAHVVLQSLTILQKNNLRKTWENVM